MTAQIKLIIAGLMLVLLAGSHIWAYRTGWSAHSDKVNKEYAERKSRADAAQAKSNSRAEEVRVVTETKYRNVYRDVVKYVQDPNRTVCKFDAAAVQLRQQAIDAANAVSLHEEGAMQAR